MSCAETMKQLQAAGTAQNRKVYGRHGVKGPQFGVSYANLGKLKKKLKTDHALAIELWDTGNHDARILATMIADPEQATAKLLNVWIKVCDNYVITDAVAKFAGKTRHAHKKADQWSKSKKDHVGQAGWILISGSAMYDDDIPDGVFEDRLSTIEASVHGAKNRTKHSMYMALIAIGIRNARLKKMAVAAARRIGKVDVDHGETGCKTPDAEPYIERAWARKKT